MFLKIRSSFVADGLVDCADSECCTNSACRDSLMCVSSPDPLDVLLRKPPPAITASFYQKMKFLIDENSVQSYAHKEKYSERCVFLCVALMVIQLI